MRLRLLEEEKKFEEEAKKHSEEVRILVTKMDKQDKTHEADKHWLEKKIIEAEQNIKTQEKVIEESKTMIAW